MLIGVLVVMGSGGVVEVTRVRNRSLHRVVNIMNMKRKIVGTFFGDGNVQKTRM